ncbi:MAG: hypothetical protein QME14_09565 [Methanobacteriaceae archaeon]|nr:hypothetical protein [Methanobacteriaceae archaeon]
MENLKNIEFINISPEYLNLIEPLWKKLRLYHESISPFFKERYINNNFSERKREILKKEDIYIDIVKDKKKTHILVTASLPLLKKEKEK